MKQAKCFYGNAKIWVALGGYPPELMFGGRRAEAYERERNRKLTQEANRRHRSGGADVSLTPTEALVSKREVEPTYGDF